MRTRIMRALAMAAAVLFAAPEARADVVVVPIGNAGGAGNFPDGFPVDLAFFGASHPSMRYQQVYAAPQFGGLSGVVSAIAFRPANIFPDNSFSTSGIDVEIRLSHTTAAPGA